MEPNLTCDPRRIAALLSGEMNVAEQTQLEAHIETCDVCQNTLTASASDIGDWTAAARHLLDDEHDAKASVLIPACLLYTSPSPRDRTRSRMPSSA